MSVDTGNLETYITRLISVNENIDRDMARGLQTLSNELAAYGASIAHRLTGNMANSIHTLGPFPRGDTIESIIESAAPYTIYEIERGGAHDWMTRTLVEQSMLIDAVAEQLATQIAAEVVRT